MSVKSDELDKAVENLATACGFDKSESASEAFYDLLKQAVDNLDGLVELSHNDGLCMDMTHALSRELRDLMAWKN